MSQPSSNRNWDAVEYLEPVSFNTFEEAKEYLHAKPGWDEKTGGWSEPIWLPEEENDKFDHYFKAVDWATNGLIYFIKKRG
jgi:hypothetical protein